MSLDNELESEKGSEATGVTLTRSDVPKKSKRSINRNNEDTSDNNLDKNLDNKLDKNPDDQLDEISKDKSKDKFNPTYKYHFMFQTFI